MHRHMRILKKIEIGFDSHSQTLTFSSALVSIYRQIFVKYIKSIKEITKKE